ncbi:unnamed protein product, partial [Ectocarpus sp. 12 AP-2014]
APLWYLIPGKEAAHSALVGSVRTAAKLTASTSKVKQLPRHSIQRGRGLVQWRLGSRRCKNWSCFRRILPKGTTSTYPGNLSLCLLRLGAQHRGEEQLRALRTLYIAPIFPSQVPVAPVVYSWDP